MQLLRLRASWMPHSKRKRKQAIKKEQTLLTTACQQKKTEELLQRKSSKHSLKAKKHLKPSRKIKNRTKTANTPTTLDIIFSGRVCTLYEVGK